MGGAAMELKLLGMLLCGLLLGGCGTAASRTAVHSLTMPRISAPVLTGLTWVHHRTTLPLYAPIKIPRDLTPHVSGYGFSSNTSYGITVVEALAKAMPFNAERLSQGQTGKMAWAYSVVKPSAEPGLSTWELLASYNLMGPSGLPKLSGPLVDIDGGHRGHWSSAQKMLWWRQSGWLFIVEDSSFGESQKVAAQLLHHESGHLPVGPGLYVAVTGATMADWEEHGLVASIDGSLATPRNVLQMVYTFRSIPPRSLKKKSG